MSMGTGQAHRETAAGSSITRAAWAAAIARYLHGDLSYADLRQEEPWFTGLAELPENEMRSPARGELVSDARAWLSLVPGLAVRWEVAWEEER